MSATAAEEPKAGAIYRHYKGERYEVVAVATHRDTCQRFVAYRHVPPGDVVWIRKLSEWSQVVRLPDGRESPRFEEEKA